MFPHVIERNGKYVIRKFCFGWEYWDKDGDYWWVDLDKYVTKFDSFEDAKLAWNKRKPKFIGFL